MPPHDASSTATVSSRASSISRRHPQVDYPTSFASYLRPEDAFYLSPPQTYPRENSPLGRTGTLTQRKSQSKRRGRSGSRQRRAAAVGKGTWKKLLWVKQSYPDNYTDEETFLDDLQRNPRWRPYEFWPLVADSTIIVQHICSVIIFICCFIGISKESVSPQMVVGWATICTVASWVFRDHWQRRDHASTPDESHIENSSKRMSQVTDDADAAGNLGITLMEQPIALNRPGSSNDHSGLHSGTSNASSTLGGIGTNSVNLPAYAQAPESTVPMTSTFIPLYGGKPSAFSSRTQERLMTAKSAILIYCSLLGLSPILKSLTSSTSSDSIWALSSWLMGINVFTFDYGAGPEAKFPASLSTNAALMASTVLASRLDSTTDVFSLTLFSIEVFGLFPVFRRHLRHHSWTGHLILTTILVILASGGLSITIAGGKWATGIVGVILGGIVTCLSMGMTSWWLIGLQRYKNEIHGPWDPARPIIRRPY